MSLHTAHLRFYAELNDFLPPERRFQTIEVCFYVPPAVRDVIESQGVPHTEIDLVLVNGESADLGRVIAGGDRVSVYPMFESLDIAPLQRLRPEPLRRPRFIADVHLGRLAAYLRMAGFDTAYRNDASDGDLAALSAAEQRTLLTRDVGLLKRAAVTRGYYIRETQPARQLAEVLRRFDLARAVEPFTRCMLCNTPLRPFMAGVLHCPACARVFWKGSHYRRMQRLLEAAIWT